MAHRELSDSYCLGFCSRRPVRDCPPCDGHCRPSQDDAWSRTCTWQVQGDAVQERQCGPGRPLARSGRGKPWQDGHQIRASEAPKDDFACNEGLRRRGGTPEAQEEDFKRYNPSVDQRRRHPGGSGAFEGARGLTHQARLHRNPLKIHKRGFKTHGLRATREIGKHNMGLGAHMGTGRVW